MIEVRPYAPNLGAEVRGVILADGVSAAQFDEIRRAFLEHQVLFFREQVEISPQRHIEFGRMFGDLHAHPAAPGMPGHPEIFEIHAHRDSKIANGEFWHSDVSCDEIPPLGTMLQLHILPPCGGDTMFSDMVAAWESLSAPLQNMLCDLTATHESEHVSRRVLELLFDHCERIDFQIRFRWSQNDMAFWDNRCCMHRAIWDYWPAERKGRRVTIKGDRPR